MKFILSLIFFIVISSSVFADPAIESLNKSTASDGDSISITGTDFGAHDLDIEWIGEDIEDTTEGESPVITDWQFARAGWNPNVVATDYVHSGRKSLKTVITTSGHIYYDYGSNIAAGDIVYITWWSRRTHTGDGQWKMFRLNWQGDIQDDYPQIVMFNNDSSYNADYLQTRPGPTAVANVTTDYPAYYEDDNQWFREEFVVNISSDLETSDGSYTLDQHIPDSAITRIATESNVMMLYSGTRRYRWFLWQNYAGNASLTAQTVWTDDIYVQVGTQARVELGDASTWSACTFREIQPPSLWTTTGITITLNQGSFDNDDTAYLYVVKSDGTYNSTGEPITFGEPTPNLTGLKSMTGGTLQ